jgi:hypothetical protein
MSALETSQSKRITSSPFCKFGIKESDDRIRVFIKLQGVPQDDSDIASFLHQLDNVYKTKKSFVCLYDVRAIGRIAPSVLWTLASYLRKKDDETRERLLRCAIVISSAFAKKILDSLFVLKKPACPLETFSNMESAKEWLREC